MNPIIMRYKALKGDKFSMYLDYTLEGIRKYEFLKIRVGKDYSKNKGVLEEDKQALALAETIRAKRQNELYHRTSFDTSIKQLNRSLFIYIEEYYNQTKRGTYRWLLRHLKIFSKKTPLISDVTPLFINRFTDYLLKSMSRNGAKIYQNSLAMFMNKAVREGILSETPFKKVKPLQYLTPERTYLTLEELKTLFENRFSKNEQIEQAFLFACFTGLRFSDVKALKVSDIKDQTDAQGKTRKIMVIRPQKTSQTTGKLLTVPLSDQAILILKEVKRAKNELIFDNLPAHPNVEKGLKLWAKKAGIDKNMHFHVSRHTFASLSLSSGIQIFAVSKLLGHASVVTTQIYAALTDEKKQKEVAKFPTFKNMKKKTTSSKH